MITFKAANGVAGSMLQKQVTSWDKTIFNRNFPMYFYKGNSKHLVDVERQDDGATFNIVLYFWNPTGTDKIIESLTETFLEEAFHKIQSDKFTYDIERKDVVQSEDFYVKSGKWTSEESHASFIFGDISEGFGFPRIFVAVLGLTNTLNSDLLLVQQATSHSVSSPVSKSSPEGKMFTYMLINSFNNDMWVKKYPTLGSVEFPTNPDLNFLPEEVLSKGFQDFISSTEAEKLLYTKDGVIDTTGTENKSIVPFKEQNMSEILGISPSSNEEEYNAELNEFCKNRIARMLLDVGHVLMSDIITYSVKEILKLIPEPMQKQGVPVFLDMTQTTEDIKKAYIYDNYMYILPCSDPSTFDWDEYGGGGSAYVIPCDEEGMEKIQKGES